jgi:hypothetical protein
MQAPATGKSLAEGQSFNHPAKVLHKVDDDGSTSAGSSDRENDVAQPGLRSGHANPDQKGAAAIVYLMDMLSIVQEPNKPSKTRSSKSSRKMQRLHRQQNKKRPLPAPAFDGFSPPPGLHQIKDAVLPSGFVPPPGLPSPQVISFPPGLELYATDIESQPESDGPYNPKVFHRELVAIFRELSQSTNVAAAVRRVRAQNVPQAHQAAETTDILTRAAEECRGTHRRLFFAFAAGLAKGDSSAFEKIEVMSGVQAFFNDVFDDLCEEVPRLPQIVEAELIPTLRAVFPAETIHLSLPVRFRVA